MALELGAAAIGAARLGDDRAALRTGAGIDRPARAVILNFVVDGVDAGGIDQHAAVAVGASSCRHLPGWILPPLMYRVVGAH